MTAKTNPFRFAKFSSKPVEGENFIGRRALLEELVKRVAEEGRHVSIHGMPHVGKSSILLELARRLRERSPAFCIVQHELVRRCQYGPAHSSAFAPFLMDVLRDLYRAMKETAKGMLWAYLEIARQLYIRSLDGEDARGIDLLELLRAVLTETTRAGIRVVLLLDEFQRAYYADDASAWREEEHSRFVHLLLDGGLALVCVTASRPRIDGLLVRYQQQLNPFHEILVRGFDEEDMAEYFARLEGAGRALPAGTPARQELLWLCGRSPLLLTKLGCGLCGGDGDIDPAGAVAALRRDEECKRELDNHFKDIVGFMRQEEEKKQRSFSHIVKCYFEQSADAWDVQDRCVALGYIDILDPRGEYTYQYGGAEKYRFFDADGKYGPEGTDYTCITAAPSFVNYLYINCLEHIRDARDLLAGFVHTLRDITDLEMKREFGGDKDWNLQVLLTRITVRNDGIYYTYSDKCKAVQREEGYRPPADHIVLTMPRDFLTKGFKKRKPGDMPILDAVNLNDHGELLRQFPHRFAPYFGRLGGAPWERLETYFRTLKTARDKCAHYSRSAFTKEMEADTRRLCCYLLGSIFYYIDKGEPAPPEEPPKLHSKD